MSSPKQPGSSPNKTPSTGDAKSNPFADLSTSSSAKSPAATKARKTSARTASKIKGKAKLASRLAAKQAEIAKLQKVTLASAYLKLGRWVYQSQAGADVLAEQFAAIKTINDNIVQIKSFEPEKAEGFKAKAKQVAKAGADAAQIKLLQGKIQKALYHLGKAAFVTNGIDIPEELSTPIKKSQAKIKTLTKEADELSEKLGTSKWNFKWVYGGVAAAGLMAVGWFVFGGSAETYSDFHPSGSKQEVPQIYDEGTEPKRKRFSVDDAFQRGRNDVDDAYVRGGGRRREPEEPVVSDQVKASAASNFSDDQLKEMQYREIMQKLGQPTLRFRGQRRTNMETLAWKTGDNEYTVVTFLHAIDGTGRAITMAAFDKRTKYRLDKIVTAMESQ